MTHSGGQQHNVGDQGQRYEVTYLDTETGERKVFGWSDTRKGADMMVASINAHPSWSLPEARDRTVSER